MSFESEGERSGREMDGLAGDLRGALEAWTVPTASESFRTRLREVFLAAADDGLQLTEQQMTGRLKQWEVPEARTEFREELRQQFLAAAAGEPSGAGRGRLLSFPRIVKTLAALAAALLLIMIFKRPAAPAWQVIEFSQGASYRLNGDEVSGQALERLGQALGREGCSLTTGEDNLALVHVAEGVLLEFSPGTELRFRPAEQDGEGPLEIEVITGGLRVATTEGFDGRVLVHTPDLTISLAGRSIGVDVVAEGTCLCVLGGSADLFLAEDGNQEFLTVASMGAVFVGRESGLVTRSEGELRHRDDLEQFSSLSEKYLF